jgi:FkbM family methyltransferase
MTLDLVSLVKEHNLNIKGVLNLGCHFFEEAPIYEALGIKDFVLVEPLPHAFKIIQEKTKDIPGAILYNVACSNEEGQMEMFVDSTNEGQSSSLLEPKLHLEAAPWVVFDRRETVEVKKVDNLEFNRLNINCLIMDIQGNELRALQGAIETLPYIDIIYTEINLQELYLGCCMVKDLDKFLAEFGFKRVASDGNGYWGDALYLK